jgi:hypothetical protein
MRMPGFTAETALSTSCVQYRHVGDPIPRLGPMILPQQATQIPYWPGLWCWLDYQDCNASCRIWPISRQPECYIFCLRHYHYCLHR